MYDDVIDGAEPTMGLSLSDPDRLTLSALVRLVAGEAQRPSNEPAV
jgi:hypothetical protein